MSHACILAVTRCPGYNADYNTIAYLNPDSTLDGLEAVGASDIGSAHAFTIDGLTLDPRDDGFDSTYPLFGLAPLLQIGGGNIGIGNLAHQDLEVFNSDGTDLGSIETGMQTSNLFVLINSAQFTVTDVTAADGIDAGAGAFDLFDPSTWDGAIACCKDERVAEQGSMTTRSAGSETQPAWRGVRSFRTAANLTPDPLRLWA